MQRKVIAVLCREVSISFGVRLDEDEEETVGERAFNNESNDNEPENNDGRCKMGGEFDMLYQSVIDGPLPPN